MFLLKRRIVAVIMAINFDHVTQFPFTFRVVLRQAGYRKNIFHIYMSKSLGYIIYKWYGKR